MPDLSCFFPCIGGIASWQQASEIGSYSWDQEREVDREEPWIMYPPKSWSSDLLHLASSFQFLKFNTILPPTGTKHLKNNICTKTMIIINTIKKFWCCLSWYFWLCILSISRMNTHIICFSIHLKTHEIFPLNCSSYTYHCQVFQSFVNALDIVTMIVASTILKLNAKGWNISLH